MQRFIIRLIAFLATCVSAGCLYVHMAPRGGVPVGRVAFTSNSGPQRSLIIATVQGERVATRVIALPGSPTLATSLPIGNRMAVAAYERPGDQSEVLSVAMRDGDADIASLERSIPGTVSSLGLVGTDVWYASSAVIGVCGGRHVDNPESRIPSRSARMRPVVCGFWVIATRAS